MTREQGGRVRGALHRDVDPVRRHHDYGADLVHELPRRRGEGDRIAGLQLVQAVEGFAVGGAVAGNDDVAELTGHCRAGPPAGAAVDGRERHPRLKLVSETELRNVDAADHRLRRGLVWILWQCVGNRQWSNSGRGRGPGAGLDPGCGFPRLPTSAVVRGSGGNERCERHRDEHQQREEQPPLRLSGPRWVDGLHWAHRASVPSAHGSVSTGFDRLHPQDACVAAWAFQLAFMRRGQTGAMRILVVDDDPGVRKAVGRALTFEGYEVAEAADGAEALLLAAATEPDAIVLDVGLPRLDGLEVCRRLRADGVATPILVLTARHQVTDRVAGLDAGADDYLVKPFALEELLARLRALLRRVTPNGSDRLSVSDLTLDRSTRAVERGGEPISLTRTEFNLLELLMYNAGHVLTREVIFERVWGYDFDVTSNSLDVYIGYLRRKTEPDERPRLIHTIRGVGYVVREQ